MSSSHFNPTVASTSQIIDVFATSSTTQNNDEISNLFKSDTTTLEVKNIPLTVNRVKYLFRKLEVNSNINTLILNACDLTDENMTECVLRLMDNSTITNLTIIDNPLTCNSAFLIADLLVRTNHPLITLILHNTDIADKGVEFLAQALAVNSRLEQFSIKLKSRLSDRADDAMTKASLLNTKCDIHFPLRVGASVGYFHQQREAFNAKYLHALSIYQQLQQPSALTENERYKNGRHLLIEAIKIEMDLPLYSWHRNNLALNREMLIPNTALTNSRKIGVYEKEFKATCDNALKLLFLSESINLDNISQYQHLAKNPFLEKYKRALNSDYVLQFVSNIEKRFTIKVTNLLAEQNISQLSLRQMMIHFEKLLYPEIDILIQHVRRMFRAVHTTVFQSDEAKSHEAMYDSFEDALYAKLHQQLNGVAIGCQKVMSDACGSFNHILATIEKSFILREEKSFTPKPN